MKPTQGKEQGTMSKALVGIGLTAVITAGVGGVAYATNQQPAKAEAPMVVVPAAQVQTATPTATATSVKPTAIPVVKASPVAPIPAKSAAPVSSKKSTASTKTGTTRKAATTTTRSLAVTSNDTPADPTPSKTIAPDDPIRQTPPPPIPGNYNGGPVQPKPEATETSSESR